MNPKLRAVLAEQSMSQTLQELRDHCHEVAEDAYGDGYDAVGWYELSDRLDTINPGLTNKQLDGYARSRVCGTNITNITHKER